MVKKGLCINCVHDSDCSLPRKFPVLQCEEFYCGEPKSRQFKEAKQKKVKSGEEETARE